ncbi:hypothetical protein SARC_17187, partial [Sphaeroforma arctica JP610]
MNVVYTGSLLPLAVSLRETVRHTQGSIAPECLVRVSLLGTGHFGSVYSGVLRVCDHESPVAIKVPSDKTDPSEFIKEA